MEIAHVQLCKVLLHATFVNICTAPPVEEDQNDIEVFASKVVDFYNYHVLICSIKRSYECLEKSYIPYYTLFQRLAKNVYQRSAMILCSNTARIIYNLVRQLGPALLVKPEWFELYQLFTHQQPKEVRKALLARDNVQRLCRRLRKSGEHRYIYDWLDGNSPLRDLE